MNASIQLSQIYYEMQRISVSIKSLTLQHNIQGKKIRKPFCPLIHFYRTYNEMKLIFDNFTLEVSYSVLQALLYSVMHNTYLNHASCNPRFYCIHLTDHTSPFAIFCILSWIENTIQHLFPLSHHAHSSIIHFI